MSKNPKATADFSLILASSVHDMKNSLGMLIHSVETLCEQLPEDQQKGLGVSTIRYEAERVNNDLIHLLGIYRIKEKKLAAHLDEFYLDDICSEQRAQYQEILANKGISLEIECPNHLAWFFDRELVSGIINNALNNASRYTKAKIKITAKSITIDADEYLEISINDDGQGYPKSILEIEPDEVLNNINFKSGSTSLGLYFASQVASLHQQGSKRGRISLENGGQLGGGLFRVFLP
ncbi:MAG: HAMP domain-containing histidine kinase [Oleiphilaceae bacterium]|nr:HAMP domain-containing histidine kinase [Oleiphilaceae bacterium]